MPTQIGRSSGHGRRGGCPGPRCCGFCFDGDWTGLKGTFEHDWQLVGASNAVPSAASGSVVSHEPREVALRLLMGTRPCGGIPPDLMCSKAKPTPPPNRWPNGPTLSAREGESLNEATLRALQARLPPVLHSGRPTERYLIQSLQCQRRGPMGLLARCHGGSDDDQLYDEVVESEEETSDGSFSQVTNAPVASPEDESADM